MPRNLRILVQTVFRNATRIFSQKELIVQPEGESHLSVSVVPPLIRIFKKDLPQVFRSICASADNSVNVQAGNIHERNR